MKISILIVRNGIEFVREVIFSPCTAEALMRFIRKTLSVGFANPILHNSYWSNLLTTVPSQDDTVVMVTCQQEGDEPELAVQTSLQHFHASLESCEARKWDREILIQNVEDFDLWIRDVYFSLEPEDEI